MTFNIARAIVGWTGTDPIDSSDCASFLHLIFGAPLTNTDKDKILSLLNKHLKMTHQLFKCATRGEEAQFYPSPATKGTVAQLREMTEAYEELLATLIGTEWIDNLEFDGSLLQFESQLSPEELAQLNLRGIH